MEHGTPQPFTCGHCWVLLPLASAIGWAGGAMEQAADCDLRAPEPLTRLPTGWAQALRLQWPSPPSPPNQPNGSGNRPGRSLWNLSLWFGRLEKFEGSLGPGAWLPQPWQLDSIWGAGPEGVVNWDLLLLWQELDRRGWKLSLEILPSGQNRE